MYLSVNLLSAEISCWVIGAFFGVSDKVPESASKQRLHFVGLFCVLDGYFAAAIHILIYEASPGYSRRRVHSWSNGPKVSGSAG
jgi:hypothetical protein